MLLPISLPRKGIYLPALLLIFSAFSFLIIAKTTVHPGYSLIIMIVIFCSSCLSSIVGFAFSAIAGASLYHLANSPLEAVQIMLWCSIAIQGYSVIRLWRNIVWKRVIPFLAGGLITVVPFCWIVLHISAQIYLLVIGAFLSLYGIYRLYQKPTPVKISSRAALAIDTATGAFGGITGPFAAFPGAAIAIWCCMRGWDKMEQRTTFQPYILIMQVVTLCVLSVMGGPSNVNFSYSLFAIPAVLACHIGLKLFEHLSNMQFNRLVSAFLIISGASMIVKIIQG